MKDDFNFGILNSWQWWSHRSHGPRDPTADACRLEHNFASFSFGQLDTLNWKLSWASNLCVSFYFHFPMFFFSCCHSRVFYSVSPFSMEFCMFCKSCCRCRCCCSCCGKVVATCNTCKWAMLFICHCVLQVLPKVGNLFPTRWQTCAV